MKRPQFSLCWMLLAVAVIAIVCGLITRGISWKHEREKLISLIYTDDHPIIGFAAADVTGPPKPMPLILRLVGTTPYSGITITGSSERCSDELLRRIVSAFPEAEIQRNNDWVEIIDIQKVEDSPSANPNLGGGSF